MTEVHLTRRKLEVLRGIAEGHTTKAIAIDLGVSPKTVEYHRSRLYKILNRHDTAMLVRYAVKIGMIPKDRL